MTKARTGWASWRFLVAPRWLAWHAFAVVAFWGMFWLGDWQLHRAESHSSTGLRSAEIEALDHLPDSDVKEALQAIGEDFRLAFEKCDALLTPTSPTAAFKIGERTADPLQMYLADIFTIAVNLAGICGVSIPCGFTSGRLPIGLQIIGKKWGEETMLRVAHAYEQATPWHKEKPPI